MNKKPSKITKEVLEDYFEETFTHRHGNSTALVTADTWMQLTGEKDLDKAIKDLQENHTALITPGWYLVSTNQIKP